MITRIDVERISIRILTEPTTDEPGRAVRPTAVHTSIACLAVERSSSGAIPLGPTKPADGQVTP
jgi:hypothetical protein